jgi:thiosulfate/3-mercaptopyruvate sulfurtransferase
LSTQAVGSSGSAHDTLVSSDVLAANLRNPAWLAVDCRHNLADPDAGERAYGSGHIPGAAFLHLDRDLSGAKDGSNGRHPLPRIADLAQRLGAIGINGTRQVVAYDQNNGLWASRLWWLLRALGHRRVAVLDGGLDEWMAQGLPVDDAPAVLRPGRFEPSVQNFSADQIATAAEIERELGRGVLKVVDARGPERYRGEVEPIDPVAGRIPGAINRPHVLNLASDGRFKQAPVLRDEFHALLGDTALPAVVHQCGSGVTACHNLLAMAVAGLDGARLYPGSWSEWSADSRRPIERG